VHSLGAALLWIVVSFVPALSGLVASPGAWYQDLDKPSWTPPGWLFGPVWTTLYLLMGIAAWLVWRKAGWDGARGALALFLLQLAVNAAWTPIFFRWHAVLAALVCIAVLWLLVLATILAFRRHGTPAALLLVPYLLWLTLATALNFEIWRLNA